MTRLELRKVDIDNKKVTELSKRLGLDEFFVRVLLGRGLDTYEKINSFLNDTLDNLTDPYQYMGMADAVKRIKKAIEADEKILIYGDYDCDGIGAVAILYLALKSKGVIADYYIPIRADEGYGLSISAIDKIKHDFDPELIITVDLGVTSVEEINYVKSLGIDIIVTDHHQVGEALPDCIIVNPCLNPELTALCGAGVIFMLTFALFGAKTAFEYIDICAISTIADMVPLLYDNRIIAKYGIQSIRKGNCRKGIKQLLFLANTKFGEINAYDIAFKIAPRLNAAGRLNSAYSSLSMLIEDDLTAINMIAEELEINNNERQKLNNEIFNEAKELLKQYDLANMKIIILKKDNWNEGVIGIVASKIVEEFQKPCILLTLSEDGFYKGSARSISSINIYEVLNYCKKHLIRFGGHAMAAGLSIEKGNLNAFINEANSYILANYTKKDLEVSIKYDAALPINTVNNKLFDEFLKLEPYGQSNPRPVFVDNILKPNFIRIKKSNHIKMRAKCGDILFFNAYPQMEYYNSFVHNIVYNLDINYYNGREIKQFLIREIVPSGEIPSETILLKRYFTTFVRNNYKSDSKLYEKNGDKPILYVAFNGDTFKNACEKYYDANKYIFNTSEINGNDSIVLSPDKAFPFEYYNKIIILDIVSDTYKKFLQSKVKNVEILNGKTDFKIRMTIESLREDFVVFYNSLGNLYKYTDEFTLYKFLVDFGYFKTFEEFLASFFTFMDVGLINIGNNDILIVNNTKVDMQSSAVFKYLTRE